MYISIPPSPEVENFQMKIYYPAGDWTPDLLNQRQTCYHLSHRGELCQIMLRKWKWTSRFLLLLNSFLRRDGPGRRWDAMKLLYWRSMNNKDVGRPCLSHHHRGWWNETKLMRWVWRNGGMKFVVEENGRNPEKNLPRSLFVHHETHMEWQRRELGTPAVGVEWVTAYATEPPTSRLKIIIM